MATIKCLKSHWLLSRDNEADEEDEEDEDNDEGTNAHCYFSSLALRPVILFVARRWIRHHVTFVIDLVEQKTKQPDTMKALVI